MGRAEYIAGLRLLARLLEDNPSLTLPWHGTTSVLRVFVHAPDAVGQMLLYMRAMDAPSTPRLKVSGGSVTDPVTWVEVTGRIGGVRVALAARAEEVGGTIPDVLLAAADLQAVSA